MDDADGLRKRTKNDQTEHQNQPILVKRTKISIKLAPLYDDNVPPETHIPTVSLPKRLFHIGPIAALIIIGILTLTSFYLHFTYWGVNVYSGVFSVLYAMLASQILHNYICACYYGPGYLPMEWTPPKEVDPSNFQYCVKCKGYKAPRAHHCSQCNRCIMKMDHHCPYINTCVGHANHKFFLMFMMYVILGCSYSCVISSVILYDAFCVLGDRNLLYSSKYDYIAYEVILTALIDCVFSAAVTAAVGVLFAVQMKGILRNKTQLEEFICEKLKIEFEKMEDFPYPYDLGKWENLKQIFCHGNTPKGNGIWWDTTEETNNLTLGLYQRELKVIKQKAARVYEIQTNYTHKRICSLWWNHSFRVMWDRPFFLSYETFLSEIKKKELYGVTRRSKEWAYGYLLNDLHQLEVLQSDLTIPRTKGWFPVKMAKLVPDLKDISTD